MALAVWWTMMEESSSETSSLKPSKLWQLSCYNCTMVFGVFFFLNFIFPSPPTQLLVCGYSSLRWQEVSLLLDSPVSHQCEKEERLYLALLGHGEAGGVSNRAEEKLCSDSVQK